MKELKSEKKKEGNLKEINKLDNKKHYKYSKNSV